MKVTLTNVVFTERVPAMTENVHMKRLGESYKDAKEQVKKALENAPRPESLKDIVIAAWVTIDVNGMTDTKAYWIEPSIILNL